MAQNAAVAAIQFALETDEGMTFLRCWNQGDFDVIRREWPDAPKEVFIGTDPLHSETAKALADAEEFTLSEEAVCALADQYSNGLLEGGAYLFKPFSLTLFAEAVRAARYAEENSP